MTKIRNQNKFAFDFAEYNGKIAMNEFLDSLNEIERAKIIAYIEKLTEILNIQLLPNSKISKHIRNGIYELRVPLKDKISRSFYFFVKNKMIVFTNGFIKKTETTPDNEIYKALKIREYWRTQNE